MNNEKIKSFRDLIAWREGHVLVLAIYRITDSFPDKEKFGLTSQMRRATISITSNIAEGFSRNTYKDKINFYSMALGSLTEVQNQIIIAKDIGYFDDDSYNKLYEQSVIVNKILSGLIKKSKSFTLNSKFKTQNSSEGGYLALISAIIIAGVLLAVVFSLSFKSFMTRFSILDTEYKKISLSLAEACADTAILRVVENSSYPGEIITFDTESCSIAVTGGPTGPYTINAKSSVPGGSSRPAISNIQVTLSPTFSVTDWKEVPNF